MKTPARYAVITPTRDEAENLRRLGSSLFAQTVPPAAWVIVDNGSTDETLEIARMFAANRAWVECTTSPAETSPAPGGPIVRAFHAGLARLREEVDLVVKVDADVSLPPDYAKRLLDAFAEEPALGIASGCCYELAGSTWQPMLVTGAHVRGAARAYRWSCLQQLLPLPERTGWDTIDELQAAGQGWNTRIIRDLRFDHHRSVGARDGGRTKRWRAKGEAAHYLGYSPLYLILRALYNGVRDPAATAMIAGYSRAALRREPQHHDREARTLLRRQQRLRSLPARMRELRASGR